MNPVFKKHLNRRTFLRGVGTALALPMMDAMVPAMSSAAASKAPLRMAFVYFPNGIQENTWSPKMEGEVAALPEKLTRVLEPLQA